MKGVRCEPGTRVQYEVDEEEENEASAPKGGGVVGSGVGRTQRCLGAMLPGASILDALQACISVHVWTSVDVWQGMHGIGGAPGVMQGP